MPLQPKDYITWLKQQRIGPVFIDISSRSDASEAYHPTELPQYLSLYQFIDLSYLSIYLFIYIRMYVYIYIYVCAQCIHEGMYVIV